MDAGAPLRRAAPLLSRAASAAAVAASSAASFCLEQLPCLPCLPPESPLFHPKNRFFFLPPRLLLARGDGTSSSSPPTPEEAWGCQQWLALCLPDLGCAWVTASRDYAPVASSAVRPSAEEEEADSLRRQGFLGGLRRLGPARTVCSRKKASSNQQEESQQDALQNDFERAGARSNKGEADMK